MAPISANDGLPKEYVGYYLNENPQPQPQTQYPNPPVAPIPSYDELANRRNRSGELQPIPVNGTSKSSRSPSPLGHSRTFSSPIRSAPLPVSPMQMDQSHFATDYAFQPNGLQIVHDSYHSATPPESDLDYSRDLARSATIDGSDIPSLDPSFEDEIQPRQMPYGAIQFGEALPTVPSQFDLPLVNAIPSDHSQPPTVVSSSKQHASSGPTIVSSSGGGSNPSTPPRTVNKSHQESKPILTSIDIPPPNPENRKVSGGEPKTATVLSPVLETRTPSPTVSRRPDGRRNTAAGPVNGVASSSDELKEKDRANGEIKISAPRNQTRSRSPQKRAQPTKKELVLPPLTPAEHVATPKSASAPNFAAAVAASAPAARDERLPVPPTPASASSDKGDKSPTWQTATGGKHRRSRKRGKSTGGMASGAGSASGGSSAASPAPEKERKAVAVGEERKGG